MKRSTSEAAPKLRVAHWWLFWRRERITVEPLQASTASLDPPVIELEQVGVETVVTETMHPLDLSGTADESEPPQPPAPAREWNIWELEQQAREQAGDAARDEEWAALFLHLREFASADGVLPMQFDGLVRESFSELIQAA